MTELLQFPTPPPILIGETDHRALSTLAQSAADDGAYDTLLDEIERARIAPDGALPGNVVRMGWRARYRTETGEERAVTLVWPQDADIAAGRISVLTPVGTALIGLSVGQSIFWTARNGKRQTLTVLDVTPDSGAAGAGDNDDNGDDPGPVAA